MKDIDKLKEQNKALLERLNASQSAIDEALDGLLDLYGEGVKESDAYLELASQLVPNEELLKSIEDEQ